MTIMPREVSRFIQRRFNENKEAICLIPICQEVCEKYKTTNGYRNYCKNHNFLDMSKFTSWTSLRKSVLKRDGYKCVLCGDDNIQRQIKILKKNEWNFYAKIYMDMEYIDTRTNLEVDHIKEVSNNGSMWDINNLRTLCYKCHKKKTIFFMSKAYSSNQTFLK